jgi:hypothetical protein
VRVEPLVASPTKQKGLGTGASTRPGRPADARRRSGTCPMLNRPSRSGSARSSGSSRIPTPCSRSHRRAARPTRTRAARGPGISQRDLNPHVCYQRIWRDREHELGERAGQSIDLVSEGSCAQAPMHLRAKSVLGRAPKTGSTSNNHDLAIPPWDRPGLSSPVCRGDLLLNGTAAARRGLSSSVSKHSPRNARLMIQRALLRYSGPAHHTGVLNRVAALSPSQPDRVPAALGSTRRGQP